MESYVKHILDWTLSTSIRLVLLAMLVVLAQAVFAKVLSARARYALWLVLLVAMVAPFALEIPVTWPQGPPMVSTGVFTADGAQTGPLASLPPSSHSGSEPSSGQPVDTASPTPTLTLRDVWTAGCALFVMAVLAGMVRLARLKKHGTLVEDERVLEILAECKALANVVRTVSVIAHARVKTPAVCGVLRPSILLPKGTLESLSREELKFVFLHELAHVKHHDCLMNLLLLPLQCLHWFNPVAWWVLSRVRADRELARDAWVLARIPSSIRLDYGRLLLRLMEFRPRFGAFAPAAGILEGKQGAKRRLTMIRNFRTTHRPWLAATVLIVLAAAAVLEIEAAEQERAPFVTAVGSAWELFRDTAGPAYHGSCCPHRPDYYEKVLSVTHPGQTLYLLFAFDRPEQQTPDECLDLLPIPYEDIRSRAEAGEDLRLTGEARGLYVIVLASATEKGLKKLILDDPFLEVASVRAKNAERPKTPSDPSRPNFFLFEPADRSFSVWEEATWVIRDVHINRTGRPHLKEHYDSLFDGTWTRGDHDFVLLTLTLDSKDRVPAEYDNLLPEPWPVLEHRLKAGEWLELTAHREGMTVLLLATPEMNQLKRLIRRSDVLADFADEWEEATRQSAYDPKGPNIFIMEPHPTAGSQEHLFQVVIDAAGSTLLNKTGRRHDAHAYDEVFDGTHRRKPGDLFLMLFSLDTPERIPEGYEDLLPLPWEEVQAKLQNGEQVSLHGEARDVRTILLAAPTRGELASMIRDINE